MSIESLHQHTIQTAPQSEKARRIRVWTPRDYTTHAKQSYPVIYMQDGQNLFEAEAAVAGVSWNVHRTVQRLIDARRITPVIIVGIDNSGAQRANDYTPVAWRGTGGRLDDYARLLIEEIKPFVDKHYRTRPGAATTAIVGSSLGGLFALHAGFRWPQVFGLVAALSPTVVWGRAQLLETLRPPSNGPMRIWIDVGQKEKPTMRSYAKKLYEGLRANGWHQQSNPKNKSLSFAEVAAGRHDESSWGRRFAAALVGLFPGNRSRRAVSRRGVAQSPSAPMSGE